MNIIIDTNIVISALYSPNSNINNILTNQNLNFFSIDLLKFEVLSHTPEFLKRIFVQNDEIIDIIKKSLERIHFVNINNISDKNLEEAIILTMKVDKYDFGFVALALELDALLWTGDKKLMNHLKLNNFNKVIDTETLKIKIENKNYE